MRGHLVQKHVYFYKLLSIITMTRFAKFYDHLTKTLIGPLIQQPHFTMVKSLTKTFFHNAHIETQDNWRGVAALSRAFQTVIKIDKSKHNDDWGSSQNQISFCYVKPRNPHSDTFGTTDFAALLWFDFPSKHSLLSNEKKAVILNINQ